MQKNMKPLLEIRPNRFIYLLLAPLALSFAVGFFFVVFLSDIVSEFKDPLMPKIIFSFFMLVGLFLAQHWFRAFLKNESTFTIYEEGFESNLYGVSAGLIRWQDIRKIEDQQVRYGRGFSAALAVYLKEPDKYTGEQPWVVRVLRQVIEVLGLHKAQQASGTSEEDLPVYIPIEALGERYAQVKRVFDEKVGKAPVS